VEKPELNPSESRIPKLKQLLTKKVIAQLRRNAGFSHFLLGENPLKAHNARFLAEKEPKMVEKRAATTNLPRLSNYQKKTP